MSFSQGDLFAADCALTGLLALSVSVPGQPAQQHQLAQPWVVVGRQAGLTLRLDDPAVSQRHAYLQVLGSRLFAIDLESRTGISLDGVQMPSTWVDPGENLAVGPYNFQFRVPSPPASPGHSLPSGDPLKELPGSEPALLASFDLFFGNQRVARWRMNRLLALVGSSTRCRVRLRDASISRVHCSLVATPRGIWVVDLRSRMGTRLRGELIELARLEEGDTLQIGNFSLRIRYRRTEQLPLAALAPSPARLIRTENSAFLAPPPVLMPGNEANLLVPLLQHFNAMQQQMFDQFQQTLVMLFQMLTSMQQEQASLVREELRLFRNATEELNRLEEQFRTNRVPPEAAPTQATPGPEHTEANGQQPEAAHPAVEQPTEQKAEPPKPPKPLPTVPETASPAKTETGGKAEIGPGENIHGWISQRIAQLQSERQSRWQRILGFLRGG